MATAIATADSKKPRRSREEKGSRSSVKKRRKHSRSPSKEKSSRSKDPEKKSRKKSMKKKQKDREKEKRKVRSISELAELVRAGQIQLPKSLSHYQHDRWHLLDQVFTILSEDDIKGMLPDILKGLKMKQVKELCMAQLEVLSDKQISDAIENSMATSSKTGSEEATECGSRALADIKAKNEEREGAREEEVAEGQEDEAEIVINVSDVSDSSVDSDVGEDDSSRSMEDGLDKECAETSLNIDLSSTTQPHNNGDTVAMTTDEVESSKMDVEASKGETKSSVSGEKGQMTKGEHVRPPCLEVEPVKSGVVERRQSAVVSEDEYSPVEKRTLAASQFLEMELRRRALEAEVRRSNDSSTTRGGGGGGGANSGQSEAKTSSSMEEERDEMEATCQGTRAPHSEGQKQGEGGDHVTQGSLLGNSEGKDILQVREMLEERLRQRALQAMLKAKKNNTKS